MVKTLAGRKTTSWIDDQKRTYLKIKTFTTNNPLLDSLDDQTGMGSPYPWLVLKSLKMPRAQYCSCLAVFSSEIMLHTLLTGC